jgi:cell filamentation protein
MYEAVADPYCYPGTTVLKNIPNLRSQAALGRFEVMVSTQRSEEPLPAGRLTTNHYRAVHRHLFQDVYSWAGRFRTVRISKADSMFCYPEHIPQQIVRLFADLRTNRFLRNLSAKTFADSAATFLGTLNAIHAFRDGNGRAQLAFLVLLADQAGHPLSLERLDPDAFLAAMISSFAGEGRPLAAQIRRLIV